MKEPQELTRNDQNAPNSIIKLSKAFDDIHASKSDPHRPFPSQPPYLVHSTYWTTKRWKNHKNWQETYGDRPNDQNPSNSIIQLKNALTNFRKDKMEKQRKNPGSWPTYKTSVIHEPGYKMWWQNLFTRLLLSEWPPQNSPPPQHSFLGHRAQWIQSCYKASNNVI